MWSPEILLCIARCYSTILGCFFTWTTSQMKKCTAPSEKPQATTNAGLLTTVKRKLKCYGHIIRAFDFSKTILQVQSGQQKNRLAEKNMVWQHHRMDQKRYMLKPMVGIGTWSTKVKGIGVFISTASPRPLQSITVYCTLINFLFSP